MAEKEKHVGFLEVLDGMSRRFEEIDQLVATPEVASVGAKLQTLMRERGRLIRYVEPYRTYREMVRRREEAEQLVRDSDEAEMRELAQAEAAELLAAEQRELAQLREMILESEEHLDASRVILEIRAGTGGDEAALFAGDLFEMYRKFCEKRRWKFEVMDSSPSDLGGYREIVVEVEGENCFRDLAYESGGHRVQRVPETEAQGRIHTSAATVAVMPEAEEVDVEIRDEDLKIEAIRSSGPGGQNVNKVSSAIRMTHVPTGIVVSMRDSRSQHQNREKAIRLIRARVFDYYESRRRASREAVRRLKVGSGDRSARIRTYNFPQNRLTDHRIGFTVYNLDVMVREGHLDDLIEALRLADREDRLANMK